MTATIIHAFLLHSIRRLLIFGLFYEYNNIVHLSKSWVFSDLTLNLFITAEKSKFISIMCICCILVYYIIFECKYNKYDIYVNIHYIIVLYIAFSRSEILLQTKIIIFILKSQWTFSYSLIYI